MSWEEDKGQRTLLLFHPPQDLGVDVVRTRAPVPLFLPLTFSCTLRNGLMRGTQDCAKREDRSILACDSMLIVLMAPISSLLPYIHDR